jgi:H+/Cl- antiporter ClcA
MTRPRRPDPPPLETNDVRIAFGGTAAWAVALVVLVLVGPPAADRWWLWVCVTGIVIGLFGAWYIPRLQRSHAALIARHAQRDADHRPRNPPGPGS